MRHRDMRTVQRSRPPAALAASRAHLARAIGPVRALEPQLDHAPSFTRDDLLTANDVAEILQIKRSTALDYMRRGVIPACKIGRRWYALRSRLDAHIGDLFDFTPLPLAERAGQLGSVVFARTGVQVPFRSLQARVSKQRLDLYRIEVAHSERAEAVSEIVEAASANASQRPVPP